MAAAILARRAAGFAVGACALDQAGRRASDCLDNLRAAACTRGGLGPDALAALAAQRPLGVWPEGRALQQLAALVALEQAWRAQGCQGGEDGLRDAVRLGLGYSLRCGSSGVPGAGDGVFACGDVPAAGRVLTVYAGTLWSAWDAFVGRGVRRWLLGPSADDYLLCQADGSAVDGSTHTAAALRGAQGFVSPSACGQLMNHPPEGRVPNACFVSLYVPAGPAFGPLALALVPLWGRLAGPPRVVTLMVSTAAIKDGDEVLVDYRLGERRGGARADLPAWYAPVAR